MLNNDNKHENMIKNENTYFDTSFSKKARKRMFINDVRKSIETVRKNNPITK